MFFFFIALYTIWYKVRTSLVKAWHFFFRTPIEFTNPSSPSLNRTLRTFVCNNIVMLYRAFENVLHSRRKPESCKLYTHTVSFVSHHTPLTANGKRRKRLQEEDLWISDGGGSRKSSRVPDRLIIWYRGYDQIIRNILWGRGNGDTNRVNILKRQPVSSCGNRPNIFFVRILRVRIRTVDLYNDKYYDLHVLVGGYFFWLLVLYIFLLPAINIAEPRLGAPPFEVYAYSFNNTSHRI